jgi:hypothetical protein
LTISTWRDPSEPCLKVDGLAGPLDLSSILADNEVLSVMENKQWRADNIYERNRRLVKNPCPCRGKECYLNPVILIVFKDNIWCCIRIHHFCWKY